MIRAYEYRIYPTPQQEEIFNKTRGLCRLYWNTVLAGKNDDHKMTIEGYRKTFEKFRPEALEWVKEVDSVPLSQMWSDVRAAFNSFFNSCNKTRKGKFVKPPRFKSKKNPKDGFRYSGRGEMRDGKLWLTRKLGPIDIHASCRFFEGRVKSTTFKRTATGKWFCKICVEKKDEKKCENNRKIGVDWNCGDEDFLVMSDGARTKCPRFLERKERRLAHLQRTMSRRYVRGTEKQSNNYQKARHAVARRHEKVENARKDWLRKLSRDLANEYEYVIVEDINLQVMASKLHHGRVVGDQGFGMLRQMLSYKTNLVKAPAPYTSMTCSVCGSKNKKLTLSDREWDCPSCGTRHDRDINAALNILRKGCEKMERDQNSTSGNYGSKNACGEPSSSAKQESPKPSSRGEIRVE
jgi:putative transposase